MATIEVRLHSDRTKTGTLHLNDDSGTVLAGPYTVLGKSDTQIAEEYGNPSRDPTQPYGDTPTGVYEVAGYKTTGTHHYPAHSYGHFGAIALKAREGQAMVAEENGRTGLLIHSGDPGHGGQLRPTNGCLRLSNGHMRKLLHSISRDNVTVGQCVVSEMELEETEASAPDHGHHMGDPPPHFAEDWLEEPPPGSDPESD